VSQVLHFSAEQDTLLIHFILNETKIRKKNSTKSKRKRQVLTKYILNLGEKEVGEPYVSCSEASKLLSPVTKPHAESGHKN